MAPRKKTSFDKFVDDQKREPEFAREYESARAEIAIIDRLIQSLDQARVDLGMSKAELARRIGAKPEIVRRIFTAKSPNPTIATLAKLASILGLRIELKKAS